MTRQRGVDSYRHMAGNVVEGFESVMCDIYCIPGELGIKDKGNIFPLSA